MSTPPDLSAGLPVMQYQSASNVVRLPTAAPRKVRNRHNKHLRAFRTENPWPGEYRSPKSRASARLTASPETLLLLSILYAMPPHRRAEIAKIVAFCHVQRPSEDTAAALMILEEM